MQYVPSPSPGGLRLISDDAGVRTLTGFQFTTTTTRASTISGMDLGPHTGSPAQVFTDSIGDELFTVTRSGAAAPYTYTVTTSRNTGFEEADTITQLEFRSGGMAFEPTGEMFNRSMSPFTFTSNSDTFTLRAGPAATYLDVVRQPAITVASTPSMFNYNSNEITVTEDSVTGGFTSGARSGSALV